MNSVIIICAFVLLLCAFIRFKTAGPHKLDKYNVGSLEKFLIKHWELSDIYGLTEEQREKAHDKFLDVTEDVVRFLYFTAYKREHILPRLNLLIQFKDHRYIPSFPNGEEAFLAKIPRLYRPLDIPYGHQVNITCTFQNTGKIIVLAIDAIAPLPPKHAQLLTNALENIQGWIPANDGLQPINITTTLHLALSASHPPRFLT